MTSSRLSVAGSRLLMLAGLILMLFAFSANKAAAKTHIINTKVLASNNPIASCPIGTDTIIIRDTFDIDVNYYPLIGGVPFEGIFIVDGGVLAWTSNAAFTLGEMARIILINDGHLWPNSVGSPGCSPNKTLWFDTNKLASCSGTGAPHAFVDVNQAGCFTVLGICCNAYIQTTDNSGNPNDLTLCQPGDTAHILVTGSGNINYTYLWFPNLGTGPGPYNVTPTNPNTTYSVNISGIFDPYGAEPPYLLTCQGSVTVKVNSHINLSTTTVAVPCASSPSGSVDLTVSGGTPPYKYLWSNNAITQDISGLPAGTYTVTVKDSKGCTEVKSAVVQTIDVIPPTLSCPSNAVDTADAGVCTTLLNNINATFSDNCPAAQLSYVLSGATTGTGLGQLSNTVPFSSGITNVQYKVNDGNNVVSCNFTVNVKDLQPPTASSPPIITGIQCVGNIPAPNPSVVTTAADNCGTPTVTFVSDNIVGGGGCPGNPTLILRRYRVTDNAGNSVVATQLIQIADTQAPVFTTSPANITVSCESIPTPGTASAADNCDNNVAITYNGETRLNGPCQDTYTLRRKWTATDNCGNTATAEQLITVQDISVPVFTSVPADVTVSCSAVPAVAVPVATDNCDDSVTISYNGETRLNGACQDSYTLLRSWTATDNCGNSTTAAQTITVQDVTSPVFTSVPANATVSCSNIPAVGNPVATDNCAANVTITYNGETRTDGACLDTYTLRRRWTASDNCGNTQTAEQVINVQDLVKPVFTAVPANITVNCDAVPAVGTPTATDNCDAGVSITFTGEFRTNGACPDTYTLRRRWTAADNCGNTSTAEQLISVQDTTKPVFISVPPNLTVNCQSVPLPGDPSVVDNCDGNVSLTYNGEVRIDGPCTNRYTLRRTWTALDNCGNSSTGLQIITVQDTTKPVFTFVPANATVNCQSVPAVGTPTATDNCSASVTITYNGETRINGACTDSYVLRRNWTATDYCGNTATAQQILTVQDTTKPVFTFIPANVTVNCQSIPTVGTPTATDNCDASVTLTYDGETRTNGACTDTYTLRRKWTAKDNCGNSATAEQIINVQDINSPIFTSVPANVTVSCEAVPVVGTPAATDECDPSVTITYDGETRTDGTCPDSYTLTRKWTANDNCGNTRTATQVIVVQDLTPPQFISVPNDVTVNCDALFTSGAPVVTDNCDASVSITYNGETRIDGSCPDSYLLKRIWTATDNCNNSITGEQILTVQDTTKPVFSFIPADITVNCDAVPSVGTPVVSDNCDASVTLVYNGETRTNGACPDTYQLRRSWKATDNCGNFSTALQIISVQDTSKPVFTFIPANVTVNCQSVPTVETPTATDNCDAAVLISYLGEIRTDGTCPDTYTLTRNWAATDNCGNTSTIQQIIQVQDISNPIFTFVPADVTVNCEAVPTVGTPSATDNCDAAVTITYNGETRTDGPCADTYHLRRLWTAEDNCGNTTTAEQLIVVQDLNAPVFTFVPANVTVSCDAVPAVGTPTATDNCDAGVTITFNSEVRTDGACPDSYQLRRLWTAEDNCGNSTTTEQIIVVQDLSSPVFTFIPADVTVNCDAVPAALTPVATDNCDAGVTITYDSETRTDGPCPDTYMLRRMWTASDNCGNSSTAVQMLTVQDTTKPVFTFVPADITVNCDAVPTVGTPTATDNCDADATITYDGETRTDGACPDTYTLTRKWTVADNCGNLQFAQQILTVQDTTKPVFTFVPADTIVNCDAVPAEATPTATDNCDAAVTITYNGEVRMNGSCPQGYWLTRRWTAVDNCGNSSTIEQVLTVQDTTKPAFTFVPLDTMVNCNSVPLPGLPTAIDNCDNNVTINYLGETIMSSSSPDSYILKREWQAVDDCGNSSIASQTMTVQDTIAPMIQCPPDMTVDANGATCSQVVNYPPAVITDNCSSTLDLSASAEPGDIFPIGVTIVKLVVADASGNEATCEFSVYVRDTTAPVLINCPPDLTFTSPDNNCSAIATWTPPTVEDACDSYPITPVPNFMPDTPFPTGTTVVEYVATDSTGNKLACSFKVTVTELIPPVLSNCPSDMTLTTDTCNVIATWNLPLATDNCDLDTLVSNYQSGAIFEEGVTTVIYTATDVWNNITTCSFNITVVDLVAPQFSGCPPDITVDALGNCSIPVSWTQPTATDNCTPDPVIYSIPEPGDTFPAGYTYVHIFVQDPSGNKDTCVFKVTVIGPQLAFINTLADLPYSGCEAVATWTPPTPTGVCGPIMVSSNYEPGDTFQIGTTQVIYIVKDTLGQSDTTSFNIIVSEDIYPVIACPTSPIVVDISGAILVDADHFITGTDTIVSCDGVELQFDLPTATDNCVTPTVIQASGTTPGIFALGSHVLFFNATDASGNTTTCSVTINVMPLLPLNPVISDKIGCPGDEITLSSPVIPGAHYIWGGPQAPYPDNNTIIISNLTEPLTGYYTVKANVNGCITPLDSALVRMAIIPNAVDDNDFEVEPGQTLNDINVLLNDIYESDDYMVTLESPLEGLTETAEGIFSFEAPLKNGPVYFVYKLCSAACPDRCDRAVVTITVREKLCGFIPNIITPNDDGMNDYLVIPCLDTELYPNNELTIYNQWGDQVFNAAPYTNNPDTAWRGTLFGQTGKNLPDAPYYYVFIPGPGLTPLKGFVQIYR